MGLLALVPSMKSCPRSSFSQQGKVFRIITDVVLSFREWLRVTQRLLA